MRVVVQVVTGPETGRKLLLGAGQVLQVGRTEWADVALSYDGQLSGVHFALETDHAGCYLKDLGSSNGTFVNGQRLVQRVALRSGDEILAGQTRFAVLIEGAITAEPSVPPPAPPVPDFRPPPAVRPTTSEKHRLTYSMETCDSGLTLCRGNVDELSPSDLAVLLCQLYPVYLVIDPKNTGVPLPPELGSPAYLFDWLPPEAAATASPVIVAQDDLLTWPTLIEQAWGSDGLICLFSRQEKPAMLDHLRRCCFAKPQSGDPNDGIIGYSWPSVLAPLLTYSTLDFVRQLLSGIEAVLVELPDLPDTWQLYGDRPIAKTLDQLGFRQQQPNIP